MKYLLNYICVFIVCLMGVCIIEMPFSFALDNAGQLSKERYIDPKDFFKVIPPAGWRTQDYPQEQVAGK